MDRATWLKQMRQDCEQQYDTRFAPLYGEKLGLYDNAAHRQFLDDFLDLLPPGSALLDAACGAGRYLHFLLERGHAVLGIDQSTGMLGRARDKYPAVRFEKVGLQEMDHRAAFDGVICMDAMENIAPEDWLLVLGNFQRALKPDGLLYFTAETIENADEARIRQAFERARKAGLPVVYGEWPDEVVYHFHPSNSRAGAWTRQAGFQVLKEGNGSGYFHLLARKPASPAK